MLRWPSFWQKMVGLFSLQFILVKILLYNIHLLGGEKKNSYSIKLWCILVFIYHIVPNTALSVAHFSMLWGHIVPLCRRIGGVFWARSFIALYEPKKHRMERQPRNQSKRRTSRIPFPEVSSHTERRGKRKKKIKSPQKLNCLKNKTTVVSQEVKYRLGDGEVRVKSTKEKLWTGELLLHSHFVCDHSSKASLSGTSAHAKGRLVSTGRATGGHIMGLSFNREGCLATQRESGLGQQASYSTIIWTLNTMMENNIKQYWNLGDLNLLPMLLLTASFAIPCDYLCSLFCN